jgi:hypothetical protein
MELSCQACGCPVVDEAGLSSVRLWHAEAPPVERSDELSIARLSRTFRSWLRVDTRKRMCVDVKCTATTVGMSSARLARFTEKI